MSNRQPTIRTFTMDELKLRWAHASGRQRCWIALALNGGVGAKDLSGFRVGEVDWADGHIERERSKTGVRSRHKPWAVTMTLLTEHQPAEAGEDTRMFLSKKGVPLVCRMLVEGRLKGKDTVYISFRRLIEKVELDGGRSFYSLRTMGATLIESIDPLATEMYLSHTEKGMRRHYAERDWGRLGRALRQMEEMLTDMLKR